MVDAAYPGTLQFTMPGGFLYQIFAGAEVYSIHHNASRVSFLFVTVQCVCFFAFGYSQSGFECSHTVYAHAVSLCHIVSQFIGKSAPLTLGVDIDAVTGATLTSQAVVDAVNQLAK